uniref:histidine kinase dimerization/phospho-acceptor domain-containing protein n=1 Tax=Lentilactobacillus hilgardii TaxID=1588 RepID=UPI00403F097E
MEVKQLTTSFNELLTSINYKNQQEKTFISNAAHELRTPIAAIRGHIQLVQRHGRDHPEIVDRSIQFINNESARMQTLVNDLLALSRADRGDVKLDYIDLTSLLNETVEEQRAVLKQTINVNIPTKTVVYANAYELLRRQPYPHQQNFLVHILSIILSVHLHLIQLVKPR